MLVEKNNITDLLPQRHPILMIDSLISQNELVTVTNFEVLDSNMFVRDSELQEGGIIENIAQSAAARAGYYYKIHNQTPPMGFIGAITKVIIARYPKVGETLRTVIEMKSEVFNITLVKGITFVGEEQIAECEMKIVIDDSKKS
jgi:3-hydroxymyristoyl/3-hydroxydecanoyl-(acyl carrier protein) dehydratase